MDEGWSAGAVLTVDHGYPIGSEAGFRRPALVVNDRPLGPRLVVCCPITTTDKGYPFRVRVEPDAANGLSRVSFVTVEHVRTLSTARVVAELGTLDPATMALVRERLALLLGLLPRGEW